MKGRQLQTVLLYRTYRAVLALCAWLVLGMGLAATANAEGVEEHQVKALFLFNFASFTEWPEQAFDSPETPLRYCVSGAPQVADTLQQLIADERSGERGLSLKRLAGPNSAEGCHILFIGDQSLLGADELAALRSSGTLTVGDNEDFVKQGGILSLLRKRKRIRPMVNLEALRNSPLRLSSKLLRLAMPLRDEAVN